MDIGGNLKAIRKSHGLSQRELAKRAGVTNSTISMIEKNSVSPSISSLEKVLSGIPLSLAEFFAAAQQLESQSRTVYRAGELPDIGSEGVIRKLVGADIAYRSLDLLNHYYPPHSGQEQPFSLDGEVAGIVIEGQLELTLDHASFTLEPGDSFYLEGKKHHQFRNPFDAPCRLISAGTRANA